MSKYDKDVQDVYAVKQLGDSIGYGHLMAIAHELWARHLESKGLPRTGAHCAVGYSMVKEQYQAEALNDRIYTIVVDKALSDRKPESNSEKPNNSTISKMEQVEDEPQTEDGIMPEVKAEVRFDENNKTLWIKTDTVENYDRVIIEDGSNWCRIFYEECGECAHNTPRSNDEPQTDCAWK